MVTLANVTKKYRDCIAVNDVSYTIERGEYFALLGPNGAGKTTIVRMLMGFSKQTSGSITVNGVSAADPASRNSIGYLAEQLKIPPFLTGREYLKRHASLAGLSGGASDREIDRVLETVSMKGSEKKRTGAYSKGMRQRLGLAAAIIGNPKLLLLDEPVSGLDPIGIRDIRRVLEDLSATGVTLILNSHLLSEVEKCCTTAGIIYKGKLLVKDTIATIVRGQETLEDVFIRYIEQNHG